MIIYEEENEETILESQTFRFVADNPAESYNDYVEIIN
jgi:hypothetical protein